MRLTVFLSFICCPSPQPPSLSVHTVEHFRYSNEFEIERAKVEQLAPSSIFAGMGLGFALSLLFFMDQNIAAAMVNSPTNK